MKILILDAHSSAALACLQNLGQSGYKTFLAGDSTQVAAWYSKYACKRFIYPSPLTNKEGFKSWICKLDREKQFDYILPITDNSIYPLMELNVTTLRATVILPRKDAFPWVFNKEKTLELAERLNIPIPATILVTSPEWEKSQFKQFPLYVKPVHSKAWRNGQGRALSPKMVKSIEELELHIKSFLHYGSVLVQEYVHGDGIGIEVLCDSGEVIIGFAHKRIHEYPLTGGASTYRVSIDMPEALLQAAQKMLREIKWHGVAMVEFKQRGSKFWLMEINGRFWGSLPLALFAGVEFPTSLIKMLSVANKPSQINYRRGVYARNIILDLVWFIQNLRADKQDPLLITHNTLKSMSEYLRVLFGRECWDNVLLRDPGPIIWQFKKVFIDLHNKINKWIKHLYILRRARSQSYKRLKTLAPRKLLIVCYGNIYRSPFVACYLKRILALSNNIEIRSGGFYPQSERLSPRIFVDLSASYGVDISAHKSTVLTRNLVDWADMIIIMDRKNWDQLSNFGKSIADKVIWLGALLNNDSIEIVDPYNKPEIEVHHIVNQLKDASNGLMRYLTEDATSI